MFFHNDCGGQIFRERVFIRKDELLSYEGGFLDTHQVSDCPTADYEYSCDGCGDVWGEWPEEEGQFKQEIDYQQQKHVLAPEGKVWLT